MRRSVSSWRASSASEVFGRSGREEDDEEALKWAALERTAEEDNERFLLKLRNRMERVGIDNPTIEVRFENLKIDAEAYVGKPGLPTFTNFLLIKSWSLLIWEDFLLLALAGKLDSSLKAISVEGQETVVTDYILKILGLDICSADTMVGDANDKGYFRRTKKLFTTGEMLVGPAKALFMDEISTGLDSSTTYQIVNSLRQSVHILGGTAVIALLQPAPETYDLFDDIILLSDGQVVYQGPRENVLEFFESMGFKCPERKGAADSPRGDIKEGPTPILGNAK
ncbi:hypothetical protein J5N97_006360 [Dioscorea zingiberensis]|uniref:ABC transporter family G domain-containing protein n=1 Tax=Dioscorea zingiberensis TaxID=325984 RepID=A0A9D5DAR7_9LILI|nr:hypothetical protein J5N97_006360 [Dioscorea zingiberensis]